jgi:hypothetical protein
MMQAPIIMKYSLGRIRTMKVIHFLSAAAALLLVGGYTVAGAGSHESGGACVYVMENMFAGPYKACTCGFQGGDWITAE